MPVIQVNDELVRQMMRLPGRWAKSQPELMARREQIFGLQEVTEEAMNVRLQDLLSGAQAPGGFSRAKFRMMWVVAGGAGLANVGSD